MIPNITYLLSMAIHDVKPCKETAQSYQATYRYILKALAGTPGTVGLGEGEARIILDRVTIVLVVLNCEVDQTGH